MRLLACSEILCDTCTQLSPVINSCCVASNVGSCLPGGSAYITTQEPSFSPVPSSLLASYSSALSSSSSVSANAKGCASAAAFWELCSTATSSFFMLPASVQSSCICVEPLDSTVYDTAFYTDATSCYSYLEISATAQAAGYSSALLGFCAAAQVTGSSATITAAPTGTVGSSSAAVRDSR